MIGIVICFVTFFAFLSFIAELYERPSRAVSDGCSIREPETGWDEDTIHSFRASRFAPRQASPWRRRMRRVGR
jgi:hypothetical protein